MDMDIWFFKISAKELIKDKKARPCYEVARDLFSSLGARSPGIFPAHHGDD